MSKNTTELIGMAAGALATEVQKTGLSWDEAIAMLGLTAKILAVQAAAQDSKNTIELASKRLNEGWSQKMDLKVVSPSNSLTH
jgi:hypothetical protein